ncbi:MAG: hypothetical protein JRG86_20820 [Deltaproteobacteria bacterium]|jgi:hypothetical protein|nr:hypothetical protein [Deltaproteobacteria bacterium]MBW2496939.1 hypothetical protein [Deltaproteobacteria bacterium]
MMGARAVVSHLAVAVLAFGLGWMATQGGGESASTAALTEGDPTAVLAEVLRIDDPAERAVALAGFFETADPASAIMLRDLLVSRDQELHVDEIAEILFASWWARADPKAAFSNRVDPAWTNRHPWVRTVAGEWVQRDPVAVAKAIDTLPQNPTQGRIEGARIVLDGWFAREETADPRPLFALIKPLEPKARAFAIERMLDGMIEQRGIDATEQYVESVATKSDGFAVSVESELMSRMGVALLDHDVERAKAWAARHAESNVGVLKHLAYYWARRDGEAAMNWAISLPDTPDRGAIIKRVWLSWGFSDAEGSKQWLYARGPDEMLMGIWTRHLRTLGKNDPDAALEVANGISDPKMRDRMVVLVVRSWMSADPEAAGAWLAEAGLSPKLEERIRKDPIPRARRNPIDPQAG